MVHRSGPLLPLIHPGSKSGFGLRLTHIFNSLKPFWFPFGLVAIFLFSLSIRFLGLDRFDEFVFDEVYFVRFAHHYLTQTAFFDNHPPLGKYLIAFGIWLGQSLVTELHFQISLTDLTRFTFIYRWLNALFGSFIPLIIAGIAYQLTKSRSYTLIASFLVAADGLLLVESRYGLINIYLITFGLLGQWLFLIAIDREKGRDRSICLILAGFFFGAAITVKWNGLGFLLGIYIVWILVIICDYLHTNLLRQSNSSLFQRFLRPLNHSDSPYTIPKYVSLFEKIKHIHWTDLVCELGLFPALIYRLIWIPHLQINTQFNFWQSQYQSLTSHINVSSGLDVHPYCSKWYSWPLLLRPVVYVYKQVEQSSKLIEWQGVSIDNFVIYDVHALGNPILWWLSTMAIINISVVLSLWTFQYLRNQVFPNSTHTFQLIQFPYLVRFTDPGLLIYLLVNYGANWLPWVGVSRCLFIYHYMPAAIFSFLALSWIVNIWIHHPNPIWKYWGSLTILSILLALLYWLPIYLGLPLTPESFNDRMWLNSWY